MDVTTTEILVAVGIGLVALLAGIGVGRASRRDAHRIEELEVRVADREGRIAQLEASRREAERRAAEAEGRAEAAADRLSHYEGEVADHFSRTSDLLREMTLQYRTIYEHLAAGAQTLCGDEGARLERAAPLAELPEDGELERLADLGASEDDDESAAADPAPRA